MNEIQNQGQTIANIFTSMFEKFVAFLPELIGAFLIVVIGLAVAALVAKLVEKGVRLLKIDHVIAVAQHEIQGKPGHEVRTSIILREIVRWFLIFIFLTAAAEVLGLHQLSAFLNSIALYIPNIIVAVIILTIALMLGKYAKQFVLESEPVAASSFQSHLVAGVAKWAIIIFGILAALIQLGIAPSLINAVAIGIIATLSLATGLAFGLGGQKEASQILQNLREKMKK